MWTGMERKHPASLFSCAAFSCFFTVVIRRPEGKGMVGMPSMEVTVTRRRTGRESVRTDVEERTD